MGKYICENCNEEVLEDSLFCSHCGSVFDVKKPQTFFDDVSTALNIIERTKKYYKKAGKVDIYKKSVKIISLLSDFLDDLAEVEK